MRWQDTALALAGIIGSCVAVIHGILTQRLMIRPLQGFLADKTVPSSVRRLVPLLLHFGTFSWFVGGLALLAAAIALEQQAKLAIGLLVGILYLCGAVGNLWGTRGRHFGWMAMAIAVVLIAVGVAPS
jgi:hypothetical protein